MGGDETEGITAEQTVRLCAPDDVYMRGFRAATELQGRQVSCAAVGTTRLQALSAHPLPVREKCDRRCLSDLHAAA